MPEPIELDEVEPDPDPFPEIPDWEFSSALHSTKLSIEFSEDGDAYLTVTAGDPDDGPYQRVSFEVDFEDIIRLGRDHITPLAEWVDRQKARDREEAAQAVVRARASADAKPWLVRVSLTNGHVRRVSVHRSECGVIKRSGTTRRGEYTFGGSHGGQELIQELRQVEDSLKYLISPGAVGAKQHAQRRAASGYVRGTNLDRCPLALCRRCNPLGENTRVLQDEIERLTNVTEVIPTYEADILSLMDRMRHLVWEQEQAHLDSLRGFDPNAVAGG